MTKLIYWLPRILSILFILFISIFALDAFGEPNWLLALITHLVPSFILTIITLIAWKKERLGAILYLTLGITTLFTTSFTWPITIPLFLISFLFFIQTNNKL